jgi:hypothetical protein
MSRKFNKMLSFVIMKKKIKEFYMAEFKLLTISVQGKLSQNNNKIPKYETSYDSVFPLQISSLLFLDVTGR